MKPRFLLKNPKSDKETLISVIIRFDNERVVFSTREYVHPKNWDFNAQRVIGSKKNLEVADINYWLSRIEGETNDLFRKLKYDRITPTQSLVKQELINRLNNKPVESKMTLFKYIEKYIQDTRAFKSHSTFKSYRTLFNHLVTYTKQKNSVIDFDNIDLEFFSHFMQFLIFDVKVAQNTAAKHVKILKVFLNAATEEGFNKNLIYKSKKFRTSTEEVIKIYLTETEIDKIYNLDLSKTPLLDRVRDLFIIGCSTGLRFSDFTELKPGNIDGDLIRLKTQKTGENVVIPFSSRVKAIFIKYNNNFPRPISNQKMNGFLKVIGELAQINEPIIISKHKGGKLCSEQFKKFELISTHCARRSFATNAHKAGIADIDIMKMTGHKTHKVFQNYVRFSQEENANNLINHSFFNR